VPPGKLHPRRVAIDASLFSDAWCRPCGAAPNPHQDQGLDVSLPSQTSAPGIFHAPENRRFPPVSIGIPKHFLRPRERTPWSPLAPSSPATPCRGYSRAALHGFGWCWTGAAGGGRVEPQGCPGAKASGRTVVEGWGGIDANGRQRGEQRGEPHLRCTHVTHEATHGRGRGLRDGAKITPRFAFIAGVPSSSTVAGAFQRR